MSHRLLPVFSRLRYAAVVGVLVLPTLFIAIPAAIGAGESRDDASHLTPANDSAHALAWTGTVGPNTPVESTPTHSYWFSVDLGDAATAKATVWIEWDTSEDLNVQVYDADGVPVPNGFSDELPASAQTKAEAAIADAVAKLTGGRYLEAVSASRAAVTATNRVLRLAVKQTR